MSYTSRKVVLIVFLFGTLWQELQVAFCAQDQFAGQAFSTPPFLKTSFDCSKAGVLTTEESICKDEELARLDVELAAAYGKRLASTSASEKSVLVQSQKKWLILRNSYNLNPYHGDYTGALSDVAEVYRNRIAALRSDQLARLETKVPEEYAWLRSVAVEGFSEGFSIRRAYASCEDPCKKKPELYRWISIAGSGIGEEPGDLDTPYGKVVTKLAAEGWSKCRSADDSGKPTIDYFTKNGQLVAVSRYYSMGVGNGIGFGITISGPLPHKALPVPANPSVTTSSDWNTYKSPDVGLELQYPPHWRVTDKSVPGNGTKYISFNADDYKPGGFRITMQPIARNRPAINPNNDEPGPKCTLSRYKISGLPAQQCLLEYESVGDGTCARYIQSIAVETERYSLSFEPSSTGSSDEGSGGYLLTDFYRRVMSTIKIK
jgi:uncharacterized protein YecT (DUF1311 family)